MDLLCFSWCVVLPKPRHCALRNASVRLIASVLHAASSACAPKIGANASFGSASHRALLPQRSFEPWLLYVRTKAARGAHPLDSVLSRRSCRFVASNSYRWLMPPR